MNSQPRSRTKRIPTATTIIRTIRNKVEHEARYYDCSKSWIVASILARHYGIDIPYPQERKKK